MCMTVVEHVCVYDYDYAGIRTGGSTCIDIRFCVNVCVFGGNLAPGVCVCVCVCVCVYMACVRNVKGFHAHVYDMYVCVHGMYVCVKGLTCISLCVCMYIYIYIYVHCMCERMLGMYPYVHVRVLVTWF